MVYPTRASHFAKAIQSPFPLPKDMHTGEERERDGSWVLVQSAIGARASTHNDDGSLF